MPEGVLSFTQSKPEELTKQVAKIKNEANNYSRNNGVALIDQKTGAGIASRYSGVDLSSGFLQKINLDSSSGQTFNYAPEHVDYVNTEKKYFYDMIFNDHKFNNLLFEYTDFKQYKDQYKNTHTIGGFCVYGSMMVKAWDAQLGKNVLIRRPCRIPMFGNMTNVPAFNKGLMYDDPSELTEEYKAIQEGTVTAEDWYRATEKELVKQGIVKESATPESLVGTPAVLGIKTDGVSSLTANGTAGSTDNHGVTEKSKNAMIQKAVDWAVNICSNDNIGYVLGGEGPNGYDCTGFVSAAFVQAGFPGISLCHGDAFDEVFTKNGFEKLQFEINALQVGDILDCDRHVALYVGNGKVANASTPNAELKDQIKITTAEASHNYHKYPCILRFKANKD